MMTCENITELTPLWQFTKPPKHQIIIKVNFMAKRAFLCTGVPSDPKFSSCPPLIV